MPGLDGLRALAVFAVIAYHLNPAWLPGGLLGVSIFFVLSGYLITDILLSGWYRNGNIGLKQFWIRRFRRLLPAMLLMLVVTAGWTAAFSREHLASMRGDIPAVLVYMSNWWSVFHQVSYFEKFGPVSPIGHLWSLAVEEQFYLVWPLLLAAALWAGWGRKRLAACIMGGAMLSAILMAVMYSPGTDPSRVYYGTDTRLFSLLCGAALAAVWPSAKLKRTVSRQAAFILDLAGALSLLAVLYILVSTTEYDPFLYQGGMFLMSIMTAAAVAVLAHPASMLGKFAGSGLLRWFGARSYGLYLWHYPVIVLTSPVVNTGGFHLARSIIQVAVTIVLAAWSWRFIEQPIRQNGFRGAAKAAWTRIKPRKEAFTAYAAVLGAVAFLLFGIYEISAAKTGGPVSRIQPPALAAPSAELSASGAPVPSLETGKAGEASGTAAKPPRTSDDSGGLQGSVKAEDLDGTDVTAIGDSVLLDIKPYLEKQLPGIVIDGKIGRQFSEAEKVTEQLKAKDRLGSYVIIELGTNGAFTGKQLNKLLASLKDAKRIILINTRVPRPWQETVNDALAKAAEGPGNITLVDWYTASEEKDAYFEADGVHLKPKGAKAYAALVMEALREGGH
ncbi:acyltransferase family protein [Paenibacillus caui]|uniref:acyltransferase family protein n=1 Tax=Paenibacillus caui TaxID=2873927 RepID=UPI003B589A36